MSDLFFKVNDDFENIIKNCLKNVEIKDMKLITTGWTNIVYEVETSEGNYFFRFPRDEFWSRTIVKDCQFSQYIYNKTDFNTSKLELKYDNTRPFSMHKKIEGVPLAEKMDELSEEEIKNVCDDIAKFMYELHNVKFTKDDIFSVKNIGLDLRDFLNELLIKHVSENDRKFWRFADTTSQPQCLVHGDFNSSNILLDENNRVSAIIDFGFSGFGNEYDDIARILSRNCTVQFKRAITQSYEHYSKGKVNENILNDKIIEWKNIDQGYINYMRGIGIYE